VSDAGDVRVAVGREAPRCPFCHEAIGAGGLKRGCPSCMAWHHADCWGEAAGRCAACGFVEAPGAAPERPARPDPKAPPAEPTFADKVREWPEQNLRDALSEYFDEYDAEQRRAIFAELERREADARARGEAAGPPPTRRRRVGAVLSAGLALVVTAGAFLIALSAGAPAVISGVLALGVPLLLVLLVFRLIQLAVPPRDGS